MNISNLKSEKKSKFCFTNEALLILLSKYNEEELKKKKKYFNENDDKSDNKNVKYRNKDGNIIYDSDDDSDSDCCSDDSNTKNKNNNHLDNSILNSPKKRPKASECECVLTDLFSRKDARSYLLQYLDKRRCRNALLTNDGFAIMSIVMQVTLFNLFLICFYSLICLL